VKRGGHALTKTEGHAERFFVFTVDVEGMPLKSGSFDYSSIVNGIPQLLDLFREYGVKSTFFLTSDVAENVADTIKEVISRGHEIACHGFEHRLLNLNSREEQFRYIKEATEIIGENIHITPIGFRAPVNKVNEKTLGVLAELSYKYDSSVAPSSRILNKYSIPNAPLTPYRPSMSNLSQRGESPVVEIPLSSLPWTGIPVRLSYIMLFGLDFFKFFLPKLKQNIVLILLHPYELFPLPNRTNFQVIEYRRIFRLLYGKEKNRGWAILRELLEFVENRFHAKHICAKEVLAIFENNADRFC
jgi:hypothetical protein